MLGEEEDEQVADEDFAVVQWKDKRSTSKAVPVRFYFTIPDTEALRELVRLWYLFKAVRSLGYGYTNGETSSNTWATFVLGARRIS